ncbi:UvrD-helicase domain-containing protein [Corynebacterium matruchotii]|uniref:ATP-dependent DNA helicase UvrD1 n=1 Tax=Corynebacterium matruchotii ATCC 33806 TaxID=566549 RepID=C0E7Z2_9CORY|nr:UvrD-helicase domain-containing protein [Corynebacterium matruchotii]EEG25517.1 putative ATP-dependent DNA helicase PcrA [Corynebacterium matruchotii ATCC 33806]
MTAAQNPSPHSDQPEQPDLFAGVTGFEAYSATPPPEAPRADEPLPPPPEEPPAYDTIPPDPEAAAGILDYPVPAVWDDSSAHQTWASSEGSADDLIADLNPQQRAAVEHSGSPLLIVAGAGSGKTAVLTRRIAYLLRMRGVAPGQILAITFTNKAAAEMRDRVIDLVGPTATRMWVATFHSACVRILREQAHLLPGLNTNFTIYDADDSKRLLGMIAKDLQINAQKFPPRLLAAAISALKTELTDPDAASDEAAATRNPFDRTIAEVYTEYQRRLRAANALDFDDLIGETVRVFTTHPEIAAYYRKRFRHVLIDEYQDTNHAQYVLISTLVGIGSDASELSVVGDSDQSIYAFRGATIRNIEEFERDYPQARTILLEQNYRSTQNILSAANAVISHNHGRREKKLWTDHGAGAKITGYVADNEHDEARFIATEIDALFDTGVGYGDIAVMYRTNNSSRAIEEVFIRTGIPYKVVGGTRFYERKEIRDLIAYLRVLDNPTDEISLRRIINTPRRGIGDRAIATVNLYAENFGMSFADALVDAAHGKVTALGTRAKNAIAAFLELMDGLRADAAEATNAITGLPDIGVVVSRILDATGYKAELEASTDPQDGARLDNLNELVSVAREFSSEAANLMAYAAMGAGVEGNDPAEPMVGEPQPGSIHAFLEKVSLVADSDQLPDDSTNVVTLMTLHTAKGLEFPVVFLIGWEDGQFPHLRALGDPQELAEERRLAYVGITRARETLYLTRAMLRASWGNAVANPASRFLEDIPEKLMYWRREEPGAGGWDDDWGASGWGGGSFVAGYGGYGGYGGSGGYSGRKSGGSYRKPKTPRSSRSSTPAANLHLEVGDKVNHDKYGLGTVQSVDGSGPHTSVTIDFGSAGTVKLMLIGGVPLEKL